MADITKSQALAELARRELERRQAETAPQEPPSRLRGMRAGEKLPASGFFDAVGGVGELGLSALTGIAGQIGGGVLGLANLMGGGLQRRVDPQAVIDRSADLVEGTRRALTYRPRLDTGQVIAEDLAEPAEQIGLAATDVLETPYPLLSTALKTGAQGALELGGLRGAGKAIPKPTPRPDTFVPAIKDLYAAGRVAFNEARINGGNVTPEAMARLRSSIAEFRNEAGVKIRFSERQHPQASALQQELLEDINSGKIDFDTLLEHREMAGGLAGNADPALAMRGMLMKNAIDDFVDSLRPGDVVSGNPQRAARSLETARALWRDASKARSIEKEIELAGNRAGQFSGSGYENALRTQFRQLHARIIKGQEKGWSKAEIEAIQKVANGGSFDNLWRFLGKFAPTGVVSGTLGAGVGLTAFGPIGAAAVPATGALGRLAATKGTVANAQNALNLPLMRSLVEK